MTSQQILRLCKEAAEMGVKLNQGFSIRDAEQRGMEVLALWEIAYQLAAHNEREAQLMPLTPPEIKEAATEFYKCKPTQFDVVFLDCPPIEQRWWLTKARGTANETPTEAEPNAGGKNVKECVFCKGPVTKAWLYCGDTCCSQVCLHNHVNAVMQKLEKRP